jgi:hypothetical protein
MAADVATGDRYIFPELRSLHRSFVEALLGLADCMAPLYGGTPSGVANTLAFLQTGLDDPQVHRHALAASEGIRAGIRALVRDAVVSGELVDADAGRLASALQATLNGSLLSWAVHRKGGLAAWLRRDLATVLDAFRAAPRRRSRRSAGRAGRRRP